MSNNNKRSTLAGLKPKHQHFALKIQQFLQKLNLSKFSDKLIKTNYLLS